MIRKRTLYKMALFAWTLLSAGVTVVVFSGNAEPYVSTPPPVVGELTPIFVIGGAMIAGKAVVILLKMRDWRATGRGANLGPAGGGLFPDLTGTVGGRTVRARTVKRRSSGGRTGKTNYTIVEADMDGPSEEGALVGPADGVETSWRSVRYSPEEADVADGKLAAKATSESVARAVTTGRSRESLLAMDDFDAVYAGNVRRVVTSGMGDMSESPKGEQFADQVADRFPGDTSQVSIESKYLVLDADRLRRQTEAVAAVADALEDETMRR